jgi:hypothetical protein
MYYKNKKKKTEIKERNKPLTGGCNWLIYGLRFLFYVVALMQKTDEGFMASIS